MNALFFTATTAWILILPAYCFAVPWQEVSGAFIAAARAHPGLSARYAVLAPRALDAKRDQNSVLLLSRAAFDASRAVEVTEDVVGLLGGGSVPIADGDVFAVVVPSRAGAEAAGGGAAAPHLLASFHGDTNGLATIPVVRATVAAFRTANFATDDLRLVFGLDANTYARPKPGKTQGVDEFAAFFRGQGLSSCWGDAPDKAVHTTRNARTFLQPQLNKAAARDEVDTKGDANPKDFVLFFRDQFYPRGTARDNTGERGRYVEGMVFPTPAFPSDHGVLSTELVWAGGGGGKRLAGRRAKAD